MDTVLAAGLISSAALYVIGIVWVSVTLHVMLPADLAIATAGTSYLAYLAHLSRWPRALAAALNALSVLVGTAAGIVLLIVTVLA